VLDSDRGVTDQPIEGTKEQPKVTTRDTVASDDSYELFRRAIVERDAEAWAQIHTQYRPLLVSWTRRSAKKDWSINQIDDVVNTALSRAWLALTPDRFDQFPNLATLLAYLRMCVNATVIDSARSLSTDERIALKQASDAAEIPEPTVLDDVERTELWRLVMSLVKTEQERVLLMERTIQGLPPRVIMNRHPDLFPDIASVYNANRNLYNRLSRSSTLRQFLDETGTSDKAKPDPQPERRTTSKPVFSAELLKEGDTFTGTVLRVSGSKALIEIPGYHPDIASGTMEIGLAGRLRYRKGTEVLVIVTDVQRLKGGKTLLKLKPALDHQASW
jgi:DNA-directed RNA polymerase specialized sigma24 family protein